MDTDNGNGKKMLVFKMRAYRMLLQIPYIANVTNPEVQSRIEGWMGETDNLWKIVRSRQLKWFGHTNGQADTLAKNILQESVERRKLE